MKLRFLTFNLLLTSFCFAQGNSKTKANKYSDWLPCTVIAGGDTFQAKVAPKNDYSTAPNSALKLLLPTGKVKRVEPSDISQLWIPWKGDTIKYISLKDDNYNGATLYRIVVDGKCKLLYHESFENMGATNLKTYYVFYKGFIQEAQLEADGWYTLAAARRFEKAVTDVLRDCPQMASEVANMKENSAKISDIIRHFNQCLDSK